MTDSPTPPPDADGSGSDPGGSDSTEQRRPAGSPGRLAFGLVQVVTLAIAGFLVWVVWQRFHYRFELEWMEGAMVDHVARVLAGQPIYAAPTYDHVAFLYHPGYFYVAALLGLWTGPEFAALRGVSILATLGSCVFLYRIVARSPAGGGPAAARGRLGGLVAVGLFLSAYSMTGCYADVGRIDPLFTFWMLAAVDALSGGRPGPRGTVRLLVAGALLLAAWLTKQTGAVIAPFVVVGAMGYGIRRGAVFGVAVAAVCGLAVWILDLLHDGWMSFFTLELPRSHGVLEAFYVAYWTYDLLPWLGAGVLWLLYLGGRGEGTPRFFHGCWITGMIVGSYLSRLHVGGAENVLIPVAAGLAAGGGLGVARLATGPTPARLAAIAGVAQMVVLFLLCFRGRPVPVVPSAAAVAKAEALLAAVRAEPGPVFLPWHGHLAVQAGKTPTAHSMAMDDVWRSGNDGVIQQLNQALRDRFSERPYPVVFIDDIEHASLRALVLGSGYQPAGPAPGADQPVRPLLVGNTQLWPRVVLRK